VRCTLATRQHPIARTTLQLGRQPGLSVPAQQSMTESRPTPLASTVAPEAVTIVNAGLRSPLPTQRFKGNLNLP
jgi:hypothetical protein